ncbi:MAG TPA: hypothetical protein VGI31_12095 [Streptosporangiaceae bacterium]
MMGRLWLGASLGTALALAGTVPGHAGPATAAAGIISTVAGGVGGPGLATRVSITTPGDITFSNGSLYVAAGGSVREVSPQTGQLTTPVGNGTGTESPSGGDGGPGIQSSVDDAYGIAAGPSGSLILSERDIDNSRVRMVAGSTGTFYGVRMTRGDIYTVAGGGRGADGGPAVDASLVKPAGITVDGAGNLVIADSGHSRVRVVAGSTGIFYGQSMTAGDIYTVAGNGTVGFSGDGGPATSAELATPLGVRFDGAGNLVIADAANNRVRVVAGSTGTFYGQAMTAGDIYTVAGNGTQGFSGDGGPATSAGVDPVAAVTDGAGNLVITDSINFFTPNKHSNRVRVVADSTGTFYGQAMTAGDIYTVAGKNTEGFSGDGGPAVGAKLGAPSGVAVDGAGNLVIADTGNNRVRVVAASTGTFYSQPMTADDIYTIAGNGQGMYDHNLGTGGVSGDGGPATHAELSLPEGSGQERVAVDGAGNLLIADTANNRIRVVAKSAGTFYGKPMTAGHIYTVAGSGQEGFSGDGGPATSAGLSLPNGVAADHTGNLVIADTFNQRVRVVAGSTGNFYGQAMTAGDIYTIAGTGNPGFAGDRGPAVDAELNYPQGLAVDSAGDLLIADMFNGRVRVVAEHSGRLYGRKVTAGDINTVAGGRRKFSGDGGPAVGAGVPVPQDVAMDQVGNLVIVSDGRVRVVAVRTGTFYGQAMTAGDIYTVTGTGGLGFSGDGGPAAGAELNQPHGVTVSAAGNLLIADSDNCRIRMVAGRTGTFYGQPATAGDIYTVAGDSPLDGISGCLGGNEGFSGDGGPATGARLDSPTGVAVDRAGDLLFADSFSERIRKVAA